jgi:hypothetical protein
MGLRKIFRPEEEEKQSLETHLPNITLANKSRKMWRVTYVPCMGEKRNAVSVLVGNPDGYGPLGRLG